MLRIGIVVLVLVLLGTLQYASSVANTQPQSISVAQTQTTTTTTTTPYCLYQTQFIVVEVQTSPKASQAGTELQVVFTVNYADGSPVTLNPDLADFLAINSNYSHIYQRVQVIPTGTPGQYRTSLTVPSDIPVGTYKLYCIHCTLTDGLTNFGPNSDTSSYETAIVKDDSTFSVGPSTATTTTATAAAPSGLLSPSLIAGLVILILIIALLVALLLRRGKKTPPKA
jgi:hypothetical protein